MVDRVGCVQCLKAVCIVGALEVAVALTVPGKLKFREPLGIPVQGLGQADSLGAGDGVGGVGPDVLDVVAELVVGVVSQRLGGVKLPRLPLPRAVLQSGREVGVLQVAEQELGLELGLLPRAAVQEDGIDVVDDGVQIGTAVLGRRLLDGDEVLPEITNGLNNTAGAIVCPERSGVLGRNPAGQGTRVRPARENPRGVLCRAFPGGVKRRVEIVGEKGVVLDGVLEREVLEVLNGQALEGRGFAPISVLQDDDCGANLLGHESRQALAGRVRHVKSVRGLLTRVDKDDGRARSLVVLCAIPIPLEIIMN